MYDMYIVIDAYEYTLHIATAFILKPLLSWHWQVDNTT